MEPLRPGQLRFRVHGPDPASDEMPAAVFAAKLSALVRAVKAADRSVNGGSVHEYMISKLQSSSPTAVLVERPLPRHSGQFISGHSGILGFRHCVAAIVLGERERALLYGNCAKEVEKLAKGSNARFSYAEIWTDEDSIVRVDSFLTERARAVVHGFPALPVVEVASPPERVWYKGSAHGSFDGEVRAVDLRGALPEVVLITALGGKQIDCVCRNVDIEQIRSALNRRVRLVGNAIYDGKSGLPRRIEVSQITPVGQIRDVTRWGGSFHPFEPATWEGDEL